MSTTDPNVAAALLEAATIVPKLEQQFGMNVGENGKRAVAGVLYQQKHGGTFPEDWCATPPRSRHRQTHPYDRTGGGIQVHGAHP